MNKLHDEKDIVIEFNPKLLKKIFNSIPNQKTNKYKYDGVYQRYDGSWFFVITYKPNEYQKSKRVYKYGFKSEEEAYKKRCNYLRKIKRLTERTTKAKGTVGELVKGIIEQKKSTKQPTTSYMEMLIFRKYINNKYSKMEIRDFFVSDVLSKVYSELNATKYLTNKKEQIYKELSQGTKNKICAVLRSGMKIARLQGKINEQQYNLFDLNFRCNLDFGQATKKDKIIIWSPEQIRQFFSFWEQDMAKNITNPHRYQGNDEDWYLLFKFLFNCGTRCSETIGLTVEKIDIPNKTVKITEQAIRSGWEGKVIMKRPKSNRSNRIIDMEDELTAEIDEYIKTKRLQPTDYLFFGGKKPISHKTFSRGILRYMKKYAEPLGLPILTSHQIRSNVETILLDRELTPRQVSYIARRMGHNEYEAFTSYVNTHLSKKDKVNKVF